MTTTARIAAVDPTNLRNSAYQSLHDAFTRGEFAPGDVLSLRSLAEQLGTSMTPVREAVRRLVAEGALLDTRSRTLQVPPFDPRRMRDLKSARLALESLVLDQAMDVMRPDDIARLQAIIDAPPAPDRTTPDLLQNYTFHFTLYGMSGSQVLLPIVEALWLQYGAYLNLIIKHQAVVEADEHKYHKALITALRRGDRDGARTALIADIEQSFSVLADRTETDTADEDARQ